MVEIYEEPQEGENLIHFRSFKNGEIKVTIEAINRSNSDIELGSVNSMFISFPTSQQNHLSPKFRVGKHCLYPHNLDSIN